MLRSHFVCAIAVVLAACGGTAAPPAVPLAGHATEHPATTPATADPILARLNGVAIAQSEVDRTIDTTQLATIQAKVDPDERAYLLAQARMVRLHELIDDRLLAAAAVRDGVVITAAEIDEAMESVRTANAFTRKQLEATLAERGFTMAAYRDDLRDQLLVGRYLQRTLTPGEAMADGRTRLAARELATAKLAIALVVPPRPAVLSQLLDASTLLEPTDLKTLLKRDVPGFVTERMSVPERSRFADTLHFKAVDKGETFDAAVRVWRGPTEITRDAWASLLTLPNLTTNPKPLGTEAFSAHDAEIRVFGYGFRDDPQHTVVLITCGEDLCHTADETLAIARLVHTRLTRITIQKL